ncbi:DHA1 family bicyclomycin/chloramphenicol resistance-like MFS transporter [Streptomyces canus]|uniref:multidrug effflux MFS transporter n=1 Tax=Streptomyces canus TaxID=58343 RepID=UPI0027835CE4|nr:multidrug effflux MFS transporter [Streptomyces canus]MDQ0605628.1 DHA1 family bicyclomycin/chloramphenicol resistance-like MFS transporter [Streptomyces canus]
MSQQAEEATAKGRRFPGARSPAKGGRDTAGPDRSVRWTGLLVTFLLGALAAVPPMSMDMYLPALPEVTHSLGASASTVQLTLTACLIGMAVGQLVVGPMSDRWGRRRPLLAGLMVYVVAAAMCAVAPNVESLIAFRVLQGLAGSAGVVIARAVVRDLYDGLAMARFFSTLLLISSVAPIIAPVIGGQVLHFTNWRGIFVVLTGIGIALTVLVWRRLPETLPPERRQRGGVRGAMWIMRGLFIDRVFIGYLMTNGFAYGALFSYIAASPFVIQDIYGASPQTFSLLFGLNSLGLLVTGQINGKVLVGRVRLDKVLGYGLALLAAGGLALVLVTQGVFGDPGTVQIAACLFVMISSLGLILPNTNALALMRTPHAAGSASALVGTSCFVMGAIASSLVGIAGKETAVPMAVVQLGSALAAMVCFLGVCRPWRNRPMEMPKR